MNTAFRTVVLLACLAVPSVCVAGGKKKPAAPAPAAAPTPAPALATVAAPSQPAERPNGSLWGKSSRSLVSDNRAHKVGDTITIVVAETTTGASTANTKTSRADAAGFSGLTSGFATLNRLLQGFNASTSGSTNGQGSTDRSNSLTTQLTVTVKEVKPDGNLLVEGTREITINKEKQLLTISGTIRPDDVSSTNTVSSVSVANATIQLDGKGTVGSMQRKGLLNTIFGWLF